jgi:hypothetical protein
MMESKFEGCGTLCYYPSGWLLLDTADEIGKYYRQLGFLDNRTLQLNPPRRTTHVTIIANKYEDRTSHPCWKKYEHKQIHFLYLPGVQDDGEYFWLQVICPHIEDIREELGLPRQIPIPWHITIGNLKNLYECRNNTL